MGLFSRKPQVRLETFCTNFFNESILSRPDLVKTYAGVVKSSVLAKSPSFGSVSDDLFLREMMVLRFETFALAILHQCGEKVAQHESRFTKHFLEQRDRGDFWKDMLEYNKAVSDATYSEFDPRTSWGELKQLKIAHSRLDACTPWLAAGFEMETIARVGNRSHSEKSWKLVVGGYHLAMRLTERLGCNISDEGLFVLAASIHGMYRGAKDAINEVRITI